MPTCIASAYRRNRLVEVQFDSPTSLDSIEYFTYDVFNRRTSESFDFAGSQYVNAPKIFVYDGDNMVVEFVDIGASHTTMGDFEVSHKYLFGPGVDQVLADENLEKKRCQEPFLREEKVSERRKGVREKKRCQREEKVSGRRKGVRNLFWPFGSEGWSGACRAFAWAWIRFSAPRPTEEGQERFLTPFLGPFLAL